MVDSSLRFGLLGTLEVRHHGAVLPVTAPRQRTLLAAMLCRANRVVSVDELVDTVWDGSPPAAAADTLRSYVMRLRRALGGEGGDRIQVVSPGYLIRVRPGELDSEAFLALCATGREALQTGAWRTACAELTAALGLWRGPALTDVPGLQTQHAPIQQLIEARLQALQGRIEADLQLGRHHEVIGELRALTMDHPLREAFHRQLMLALHRAERRAEALDVFQGLRSTLAEELGVAPSPSVRDLHRRILGTDPQPASAAPSPDAAVHAAPAIRGGTRHQLPADTGAFTGRDREVHQLLALARETAHGPAAGRVTVCAIDGMPGVGKSALALHAGHRLREQFPDGQLFIDLRGHAPGIGPLATGEALDWLLRSLGVPPQSVPQDTAERAALYRDRLAGTRTLIVLDNAAGTAQVRPLLPGAPGCLVLVTGRRRLTGLDDAHVLALDALSEPEAIALLLTAAGPGRIPRSHPSLAELTALCGRLPLTVRIIAARLRHHRALRVEDVVDRLRDEQHRLALLQDEDRSLTAAFDLSYRHLADEEQRMFRCLGRMPGPDVDTRSAAGLSGNDHRTTERLLEALLDHNLLVQHAPGRYRLPDLLRLYAGALPSPGDPVDLRDVALKRLLHAYRFTERGGPRPGTPQADTWSAPA
jgi:DNA-binding SARP family transcriptional activator